MNKSIVLLVYLLSLIGCGTKDSGQFKRDVSLATVLEVTHNKEGAPLPDIWWYTPGGPKTKDDRLFAV